MTLVKWNRGIGLPSDVLDIQREISRMFSGFFQKADDEEWGTTSSTWVPSSDIAEREDAYIMKLELPGVLKDDVKITLQENTLTVRGEKRTENDLSDSTMRRTERIYGSFSRSFTLPTRVKTEEVDARYQDGILTIIVPKADEAVTKQIDIKVR